jgi:hypothetical protein
MSAEHPPTLTHFVGVNYIGHAVRLLCENECCVTHYGTVAADGVVLFVRRDLINEARFSFLDMILNKREN